MKTLLWLDDTRNPNEDTWSRWINNHVSDTQEYKIFWVQDYHNFIKWIKTQGLPNIICFDHDLGLEVVGCVDAEAPRGDEAPSGYDAAKWLVDYCIDNDQDLPKFVVQSANPVGKKNIETLFKNFIKFKNN